MNFWKEYKFALLKKMSLHSSTSRHLPHTHPLAPDFKIQYLLCTLPSPAFHPNHHVLLVPFSPYMPASQPAHLISVSLSISLFFFQPAWVQRTEDSQERQVCPLLLTTYRQGSEKWASQNPSSSIPEAWAWSMQCQVCPAQEAVDILTYHKDLHC